MVLVEDVDYLLEMHDCQERFNDVFFFWVTFLYNKIKEL